jgi:O-antigen/teichoic acid export membrane protein
LHSRVIFLIARLTPSVLGVVITAVLTRVLDPVDYGLYALGLSITFFVTIGGFEWLGLSVLRMASTAKKPELFFGTVMTCFSAIAGLCAVAAGLALVFGGLEGYATLTAASLVATFASAWVELKQRLQMAELRQLDFFKTSVGRGIVTVIFVCGSAYIYRSAAAVLLALGVGTLLVGVATREQRLNFIGNRFDPTVFRTLLRFGLPLAISVGLGTILMSVDKWMLQGLLGPRAVGMFTAATLVTQMPLLALAGGIGPWAYSLAVQALEFASAEQASAQLEQNFIVLFGIVLPGAVGVTAVSSNLAHLMVGEHYWESAVLLAPWLSASAVIISTRAFYVDIAFQLGHRTSPLIWTTLLAVVVNVAMDFWLIPTMGQLGAAIGSFTAVIAGFVVAAIASRSVFRLPLPLAGTVKIVASTGLMYLMLHQLRGYTGVVALAWQIGAGVFVYGVGLVLFNVLGLRDRLLEGMRQSRWRCMPRR